MTPEEERQALNEMALEDHGGFFAQQGGLQVDPAEAEAMRDRALAQYLQRQEDFDRFRQQEAERKSWEQTVEVELEPEPEPEPDDVDDIEERLAAVPGLGPAKIKALLQEFDSLQELQQADEEDLVAVNGIGERLATEIVRALR